MSGKRAAMGMLIVLVGVALALTLRGGGSSADSSDKKKPAANAPSSDDTSADDTRSRPALRPRATNRAEPRVEVRDDGTVIRDHRTKTAAPSIAGGPTARAKGGVPMANTRIRAVRAAMQPVISECTARHPVTATGKKPKLRVILSLDIADDRMSVTSAKALGNRISDPEALVECVRSQMEVMDLPANGHANVTGYKLRMGFPLTATNP